MKRVIGTLLFSALALAGLCAQSVTYRYTETCGTASGECVTTLTWDAATERITIDAEDSAIGESHLIVTDKTGATDSWKYRYPNGDVKVFTRKGNSIEIALNGGAPVQAKGKLDASPWYATMDFSLSRFLSGGGTETTFWTVNPANGKAYKMKAIKMKAESVPIGGRPEKAVRVQVTANGVPAAFFSINYWYRESDSVFLKFEGTRGAPGSPKYVIELADDGK